MSEHENHGLGRLSAPDPRDRNFMLSRPLQEAASISYRYWITTGAAYDQGWTSQCVAYAGNRWLTTNPIKNAIIPFQELYDDCQQNDEWLGENYDGTSVRALFRVLKRRGLVSEYRWTWDVDVLLDHVLTRGPLVVGTDWYGGMFEPDKDGFVHLTGAIAGGHAWTVIGASRDRGSFRAINSWGAEWGQSGRFWISFVNMHHLLLAQGEACSAFEVRIP
jgi:hypothetical protein